MSKKEALAICRTMFAQEPAIQRVDGEIRTGDDDTIEMDFAIMVEGDLYESEKRVVPLVAKIMGRMPTTPVEFVVLPLANRLTPLGAVLYRRSQR